MKRLLTLVGSCVSVAFLALSTAAIAGTIEGTVTLGAPEKPLELVEVQFFDASSAELLAKSTTGEKGNYSSGNLPEGDYRIRYSFESDKLLPEFSGSDGQDSFCSATSYFVGAKDTLIVDEAMVSDGVSPPDAKEFIFYGRVIDSITGSFIEGVVAEFRDGANGLLIDTIKEGHTTTDESGYYSTTFKSGSRTIRLRFFDPSDKYFPEYAELKPRSDDFCSGTEYEGGIKHEVNATLDLVPEDQVQVIIDTIDELSLPNDVQNSLGTPLVRAVDLLTDANPMNDNAVCAQLRAFISRIDIQERQGRISTEDADKLRQSAKTTSVELGC